MRRTESTQFPNQKPASRLSLISVKSSLDVLSYFFVHVDTTSKAFDQTKHSCFLTFRLCVSHLRLSFRLPLHALQVYIKHFYSTTTILNIFCTLLWTSPQFLQIFLYIKWHSRLFYIIIALEMLKHFSVLVFIPNKHSPQYFKDLTTSTKSQFHGSSVSSILTRNQSRLFSSWTQPRPTNLSRA